MSEQKSVLRKVSNFFVKKYRTTWILLVAIIIAGVWGVANNQRQDFPPVPTNFIQITAVYPGASPADVEQDVIIPIEQAVDTVDDVSEVRSSSSANFGHLFLEMSTFDNLDKRADDITNEIATLQLPDNVETNVTPLDAVGPVISLGIVSNDGMTTADLMQYSEVVKNQVEASSSDISRVDVYPSNEFVVKILLNNEQLTALGLTYDTIQQIVRGQITTLPGGTVETVEGNTRSINIKAPIATIDDIKDIAVGPIQLSDIASVERVPSTNDTVYGGFVRDGTPQWSEAVYLLAYKTDDGDIIHISDAVHDTISNLKADKIIPDDIDVVVLYDTTPFIRDSITSLIDNGLIGLFMILIVLLFFINLRTALTVSIIIPLAFLVTLFILPLIGFTINILTLFAMILTLGILVDNAIVIAEGTVHEIEKKKKKVVASLEAIAKLGPAVTAATLTTVIVFIPFAMIGGIIGEFMKYIPFTIIIMLVVSYVLAIIMVPFLSRYILKEETTEERLNKKLPTWQKVVVIPFLVREGQKFIEWLQNSYSRGMKNIFAKRWKRVTTVAITILLIVASFGFFAGRLEFEQFPSDDSNLIQVSIDLPSGTSDSATDDVYQKVQDIAISLPYFQTFYSFQGQLFAIFTEPVDRTDDTTIDDIASEFNEKLGELHNEFPPESIIEASPAGVGPPNAEFEVTIELKDSDSQKLTAAADDLESFIKQQDGVEEVKNGPRDAEIASIEVAFDKSKLDSLGINSFIASQTINAAFSENEIGSVIVREDGISDKVLLGFDETSTDSIDDLKRVEIPTLAGSTVKLDSIAKISEVSKPESITRINGERSATVNVALDDSVQAPVFEQKIKDYLSEDKLSALGLDPKEGVSYGGVAATQNQDLADLQIVFVIAVLLVYLVLIYQFNSFGQPALILLTIPIALIGVFPGLYLINSSLNFISALGVIALVGIVVNDAIVFITTYNRYKVEHADENLYALLARTGKSRFKPILSTSITTIFGILPLTIRDPFWTGLGTSIIAGLVFSTIGTLVIIPVIYTFFVRKKKAPHA